jgi:hypothetical protein
MAWLLAFPLMAAGTIAAHGLAYRLVVPDPQLRADVLDRTGHGYLAFVPVVLGTCAALLAAGLAGALRRGGGGSNDVPAGWQLALLPPVAFTLQEHLERLLATGRFPLHAVADRSFLTGLALQVPFALLALLIARLLGRAALALGRALLARRSAGRVRPARGSRPRYGALLPRLPLLALGSAQRGPPL